MLADLGLVVVGLAGLFFGGESLVKGAARLASELGIPVLIVGLTIVAFGTSTPELLVSLNAALGGSSDISLGNIVGSNIANIALILGVAGIIYPITVEWRLVRQEIPLMIIISLLLIIMSMDGVIGREDGLVLFIIFIGFVLYSIYGELRDRTQTSAEMTQFLEKENIPTQKEKVVTWREVTRVAVGIGILMLAADFTVDGAVGLAEAFGIPQIVIGVTIVAVGTSLPELVTSVLAAVRKESDIAVGNVIGSNIFNIVAILGLTSMIQPIQVNEVLFGSDYPAMMFFALLLVPFVLRQKLTRVPAAIFLVGYVGYLLLTFAR